MSSIKKKILPIVEFVLVVLALSFICYYINRGIVLKAIYKDDLYDWSWFRGTSFFDFAIKFYDSSHYRPVFEAIQYLIYTIVGTNPLKFVQINKIYNVVVAVFIYYFVSYLDAGMIISMLTSVLYLISHYAYYQIGQAIGPLETTALLFSLIILCLSISIIGKKDKISEENGNIVVKLILCFAFYFLLVFDHERYLAVAGIIILAILFSDGFKTYKGKVIALLVFALELVLILYIRYIAIGKVLPAGTGGTKVEDTFSIMQFFVFCFEQLAIIFGLNIGPEHLVGIDFASIENIMVKKLTIASIAIILAIFMAYIVCKIRDSIINNKNLFKTFYIDIIFISFIASLIVASSVTVRVELRFVYTSFIAMIIYLAYICACMKGYITVKYIRFIPTLLFLAIFLLRAPIEMLYRSYFYKIYCYVDMSRINSIYDNTIGSYGLDDILHKKKIYVINKVYDMTNFYAEYLFKIYDENNVGNAIILVNDISEIDFSTVDDETIILYENHVDNTYEKIDIKDTHS